MRRLLVLAVLAVASLLWWNRDGETPGRSERPGPTATEEARSRAPAPPAVPYTDAVRTQSKLAKLLPTILENDRWDFVDEVVDILGRVPRKEILDALVTAWMKQRAQDSQEDAYERFCRSLVNRIPRSDLILLWNGYNLDVAVGPPPFVRTRMKGADPYLNPKHFVDFHDFMGWYPAYQRELELPPLGRDELRRLHEGWVVPLERLPTRDELRLGSRLLRQLEARHEHLRKTYGEDYEFNTDEDRAVERGTRDATRELFAAIKAELPGDYDRLRKSDFWELETYQAGLLHDGE